MDAFANTAIDLKDFQLKMFWSLNIVLFPLFKNVNYPVFTEHLSLSYACMMETILLVFGIGKRLLTRNATIHLPYNSVQTSIFGSDMSRSVHAIGNGAQACSLIIIECFISIRNQIFI